MLFALGAGDQIAGRDDSAYWPPEVTSLPSIGYQFRFNAESILSLRPSLVIGRDNAQPREAVERVLHIGHELGRTVKAEKIARSRSAVMEVIGRLRSKRLERNSCRIS